MKTDFTFQEKLKIGRMLNSDSSNQDLAICMIDEKWFSDYKFKTEIKIYERILFRELWKYATDHKALLEFSKLSWRKPRWSKKLDELFIKAFPNAKFIEKFPYGFFAGAGMLSLIRPINIHRSFNFSVPDKFVYKPKNRRKTGYVIPFNEEIFLKNKNL